MDVQPSYVREAVLKDSLAEADKRLDELGTLLRKAAEAKRGAAVARPRPRQTPPPG